MESDIFAVVIVNAGSGDYRPAKILHNRFRILLIGLGVNIKAMFIIFVTGSFCFFLKERLIFFSISLRSATWKALHK